MKKPKNDITGQTFGLLLVDRMEYAGAKKGFQAICQCLKCGSKEVIARPDALKSGHKKSCGCTAKYVNENLVGQKFGHLEVTGHERVFCPNIGKQGKYRYFAICKCHNCGKDSFRTLKASLKRGSTTSCGCSKDRYSKTTGELSPLFKGYKSIPGKTWHTIKTRAERRGLSVNLSIEQMWDLFESQERKCALTGIPLVFAISNRRSSETTASLDRIDSNKGYDLDNVQWVHKEINIMKNVYSLDRFVELCALVTRKQEENK